MRNKYGVTRTWFSINMKIVRIQHRARACNLNSQTNAIFSNTKKLDECYKSLTNIYLIRNKTNIYWSLYFLCISCQNAAD